MASYPRSDKWIWLWTEMPQDVGIWISNWADITTELHLRQQLYINI